MAGVAAFVDACVLAGALKRNVLLSLAEAGLLRIRWSQAVLDETRDAIEAMLARTGDGDAAARARRAVSAMTRAFEDAMTDGYDIFLCRAEGAPDPDDAHVIAAALKARVAIIVTDNVRHFPIALLTPLGLRAIQSDSFIADSIERDRPRALEAIGRMRRRFGRPEMTADRLLLTMEERGLIETASSLRSDLASI